MTIDAITNIIGEEYINKWVSLDDVLFRINIDGNNNITTGSDCRQFLFLDTTLNDTDYNTMLFIRQVYNTPTVLTDESYELAADECTILGEDDVLYLYKIEGGGRVLPAEDFADFDATNTGGNNIYHEIVPYGEIKGIFF